MVDDNNLMMFITSNCNNCPELDCKGAYDASSRDKCGRYDGWLRLSEVDRSKLFIKSTINEIDLLEELTQ